jgi:hypothetical protein
MQNQLPVEIGVLCTYIEHLCALTVVFNRAQRTGGLHNVTLPRSWLSKVLANFSPDEAADKTINFWLFPSILGDLIKVIYTGIGAGMLKFNVLAVTDFFWAEHLLFGPELRQLTGEGIPIRNMFIARLCVLLKPP